MVQGGETWVGDEGEMGSGNTTQTGDVSVEEEEGKGLSIRHQWVGLGLGIESSTSVQ